MTSAVGLGASLCVLLDQAALASQRVPFWLLVTGLSLATADDYRSYTDCWLVSWLITFLAGYGGGFSSAMLLQVSTCGAGSGLRVRQCHPAAAAAALLPPTDTACPPPWATAACRPLPWRP
jgi:hypothetical protein